MKTQIRAWAALVAALALMAGCAQPMQKQGFDGMRAVAIKTLVVAQRPNQDAYTVRFQGLPGQDLGAVAALIQGVDEKARSDQLTKAIDPAQTRLQDRFSTTLQQKLAAAGYETRHVVLPRIPSKDEELLAQVKARGSSGDAVLAIAMFGEYTAVGAGGEHLPKIGAYVRVIDMASGAPLYQESLAYCAPPSGSGAVVLPCDPRFRFRNFEALVAEPAKARDGLIAGLDALAARVAADLRRN
jgi:hypothetical protein